MRLQLPPPPPRSRPLDVIKTRLMLGQKSLSGEAYTGTLQTAKIMIAEARRHRRRPFAPRRRHLAHRLAPPWPAGWR